MAVTTFDPPFSKTPCYTQLGGLYLLYTASRKKFPPLNSLQPELCAIQVYIAGIGILDVFGSRNLDLDPMTFIYELGPNCLELYRMCKYELAMSRLSKVIV